MTITISSDDPRSIKAVEIAASAGQWLRCRTPDGHKAYGVPSQCKPGRYYLVTQTSCSCEDAKRHSGLACKHQLAVRFHVELVKAGARPLPTSATLDGLEQMVRERRPPLERRSQSSRVAVNAAEYDRIFKWFEGA
jgi:hypothetical protein